ncbi:MFS transporter [Enterobacter sp. DTU_2021_1002640_1_SI_PRY_ASU_LCPMC_013]|uniref:MFS transporter n=1 Tax=Enterobacter sp. DTU_2021_1002640_1_SI_PRY_ASU_LCPMC_013 TaxID=3077940 RepID=UPI0028ECCCAF|nr:MFS transporter [Enterobacter sp. DTU_2021_1002640_1_SI_PRY_ASU_LCPMC_013]WNU99046.1 MFS transporter [Enterobacter sp. DTU_2021_1002640_1_SI_PRY_ASU_LCPMC_013]
MTRNEWHMDASYAGSLQTIFNISNALALFAASWLSDYFGPRRVYLVFSWIGGIALLLFGIFAHSYFSAALLIGFIGLTQGGAYTPAIMMAIQMHSAARRGYAVGMILAGGSFGYLFSLFISSWGASTWGTAAAFYLCAGCVFAGSVTSSLALRNVSDRVLPSKLSHPQNERRKRKWNAVALLLLVGYIAHCWELLGSWTWTPSLIYNTLIPYQNSPVINSMLIATVIHLSGMLSTFIVGTISDYFNRATVLIVMGGLGGLCSLLTGWTVTWGTGWVLVCAFIGNFFILGDSGVLSAAIADNVDPKMLGRIMGIRSLLGFGIGSFSPLCFGMMMDLTGKWEISYTVLAAGGCVAFITAIIIRVIAGEKIK